MKGGFRMISLSLFVGEVVSYSSARIPRHDQSRSTSRNQRDNYSYSGAAEDGYPSSYSGAGFGVADRPRIASNSNSGCDHFSADVRWY